MSTLKSIALLIAMSAAALPAVGQETYPVFQGPDGRAVLDSKTFRAMTISQRLWSLQDQRRRVEVDLMDAASAIHELIATSSRTRLRAKTLGISDPSTVRASVMKANSATLRGMLDTVLKESQKVFPDIGPIYADPLNKALTARTQMETIDDQIKQLKSELAAVEGSR